MKVEAIVCIDSNNGISKDGKLPWLDNNIGDLEYVRILTSTVSIGKKNIIIVGSKTFETLPPSFSDTQTNREVFVLSKSNNNYYNDPKKLYIHLMQRYYTKDDIDRVFVFGGAEIYKIFLLNNYIDTFYITQLDSAYTCNTFFPKKELIDNFTMCSSSNRDKKGRTFQIWNRIDHPEYKYIGLLQKALYTGEYRNGRNGETHSLFGEFIEFDIEKYGFPLLTTKKMFFRGIAEELFWFLKADTNANNLKDKGVHIWDGNTTREYLDSIGLTSYPDGIAGPIYGFQWRNFNGEYIPNGSIELETSRDQLYNCLKDIKYNNTSRRIIFSGWNPNQLQEMCLPPCHVLYQFYVNNGKLNCQMYQRSADLFLGLPFNIASTALLTSILSNMCGLIAGKIRICIGDAHIYKEHRDCVLEQITRKPLKFCNLTINNTREKLEEWTYNDISIEEYVSHGILKAVMKA
jgi:dihydrofolate reductase/thymidylate synthase